MRQVERIAAATLVALLIAHSPTAGQETGTGDGSKTGDGSTPFTGLSQAPEANLFLGSATTTIPFEVPAGRNSMTPQLALGYSSSGGPSPYGHGWELSLPRLQRTTKHGVLSCTDTSLHGQLVLTLPGVSFECTLQTDGTCAPHVEAGFIRIKAVPGTDQREFKVTDKSGITYTFGGTGAVTSNWTMPFSSNGENAATGSTITKGFDPSFTPCRYISQWALRRVEDPNNNYIEYRYVRDGGMLYPHSIAYGAHAAGPTAHLYTVQFLWQTRNDPPADPSPSPVVDDVVFNALGGYAATMNYRLRRINVTYNDTELIRGYNFTYETGRIGRQTFLELVTLLGNNGTALENGAGDAAATMLTYHPKLPPAGLPPRGFEATPQTRTRPALSYKPARLRLGGLGGTQRDVLDMNGDGFADLVDTNSGGNCFVGGGARAWSVYFGSPAGFSDSAVLWYFPPQSILPDVCAIRHSGTGGVTTRYATADITGDGIPDYIDALVRTCPAMGQPDCPANRKYWTVYPGGYVASTVWGFGNGVVGTPIKWLFAAGEGSGRDNVTRNYFTSDPNYGRRVFHDLLDLNGDGLLDLVWSCGTACGGGQQADEWELYLNNGTGNGFLPRETFQAAFAELTVTSSCPVLVYPCPTCNPDCEEVERNVTLATLADINGDGLADHLNAGSGGIGVCLNSGRGMLPCENWPVENIRGHTWLRENRGEPQDAYRDLIDMNGDGLPDVVDRQDWSTTNKNWRVYLNRGNGLEQTHVDWPAPRGMIREAGESGGATTFDTFDVDGDDMVDFVDYYNAAAGGSAGANYAIYHAQNGAWRANGSGVLARADGVRPDLLVESESGVGATTRLRYRPSTQWDNNGSDTPSDPSDLPFNVWTVTEICHDDATGFGSCDAPDAGHQTGMQIQYENGRYDPVEREFRGFGRVTSTAIGGGGSPPPGTFTIYHQTAALSGKLDTSFLYDASGGGTYATKPIARTKNKWECFNLSTGVELTSCPANPGGPGGPPAGEIWVRLKEDEKTTYSSFGAGGQNSVSTYNSTWHVCGGRQYGNVEDTIRGSGTRQLRTHTEYACNDAAYIVDKPTYIKVFEPAVLEEKWFEYDGGGMPTRGNLTRIESWIDQGDLGLANNCSYKSGAKCAVSIMAYDAGGRGVLVHMTDPNGNGTTTSYDDNPASGPAPTWIYPETVTRPLGHKVTTAYDPKCGALLSKTIDYVGTSVPADAYRWRNTYDNYCRLETTYRPGEVASATSIPYRAYTYKLGARAPFVPTSTITDSREPNHPSGFTRSAVLGDGLGRVIQRKSESVVEGALKVVVATMAPNSFGRVWQQLVPEAFDTASFEAYTPHSSLATTMLYDAAGRLTKVTHPDGKFRTIDPQWDTTTQDECYNDAGCVGIKVVEKRDSLGRVVERKEIDDSGAVKAARQFDYDGLDRVIWTRQGDGTTWRADTKAITEYDTLGRKVKFTDPDSGPGGPSAAPGVWRYGYDPGGNLRYQDDPKTGRHIQFCYDGLNRLTKKKYFRSGDFSSLASCTANVSEQITYTYDGAAYGVGRVDHVTDLSGVTTIPGYTPLGQPTTIIRSMDGVDAPTDYFYDSADHITQTKYPDVESVGYSYDAVGRVKQVRQVASNPVYLQNLTYDVFGRPREITHGNASTDTRSYEPAVKNFRLKQIKVAAGGSTRFQFDYLQYDANGRLTQLDDSTPGTYPAVLNADVTFTYDGLGRLLTADDLGSVTRSYGYDAWGNITSKEGATIAYDGPKPHQPRLSSGVVSSFGHDDNGNRTNRTGVGFPAPTLDYQYDMDDRLRLIDAGGEGVEFSYDHAGRRTKEIRGTVVSPPGADKYVDPAGAEVTYHYTDFLEVTHYPDDSFKLRKYYFAGELLVASQERTPPSSLQVATVGGDGLVRVASLMTGGGAAMILRLRPDAAQAAAALMATAGVALLCFPRRRRAVVGVRVGAADAIVVATAVLVGTLPWPLLVRPVDAKGQPPTPTPVPAIQVHHYHLDHLSSPQLVTDGSGSEVKQIRYTPYGEVRTYDGDTFTAWDDREFTGYQTEPLSGHAYAGARFYDSDFALFLTHDPARQFDSPYTYTNWNPVGRTDPTGLFSITIGFSIGGSSGFELTEATSGTPGGSSDSGTSSGVAAPTVAELVLQNTVVAGQAAPPGDEEKAAILAAAEASGEEALSAGMEQALEQGASARSSTTIHKREQLPNPLEAAFMVGGGIVLGRLLAPLGRVASSLLRSLLASPVDETASGAVANGMSAAERLAANKVTGASFESTVGAKLEQTGLQIGRQVTVKTQSGVQTRFDFLTRDAAGKIGCIECKSSAVARLTSNQTRAFPEIAQSGGTIAGAGKPGFPGGTQLPPTKVDIIRPPR